jgi:hypothetical protein
MTFVADHSWVEEMSVHIEAVDLKNLRPQEAAQ